ncbi:MAG: two-component system activity regulator YycH, partial [Leuconostoc falkenbergense]
MRNNRSVQGITMNVILTVAILISIILTAFVFMSIGQQQNVSPSGQQDQQSVTAFRPTNYIVNDKDGIQNMVMHADNQQIKTMRSYLTSAEIKNPHKKKVSNTMIIAAISKKQAVVYRYPDVVPIDYFNARYNQHIAAIKNFNFDYFVLSL